MEKYKLNRKLITFKCDFCGQESTKPESEYLRNIKLGRHNFCSRACAGKHMHTLDIPLTEKQIEARNNIKNYKSNRIDNFTPFRSTLNRIKHRFKEVDITLEDLKDLWIKLNGKCAYTHINLQLPIGRKSSDLRYQASLDRIDSSKGYIKGNVQFVAAPINLMKSTISDTDFKSYLKEIVSAFTENLTISSSSFSKEELDAQAGN